MHARVNTNNNYISYKFLILYIKVNFNSTRVEYMLVIRVWGIMGCID